MSKWDIPPVANPVEVTRHPKKEPNPINEAIEKENIATPEKEPKYPMLEEIRNQIRRFSGEQKLEVVRTSGFCYLLRSPLEWITRLDCPNPRASVSLLSNDQCYMTKAKFITFERIRRSGLTNMYDINEVRFID